MIPQPLFLPVSREEKAKLGIEQFDIILVSGDAYVDHPSFGIPLLGRVLWDAGFTVGIIAQPDWKDAADFTRLGKPKLFFGISSGNVDSMVNNFTPNLKRRSEDVYSPGGIPKRPDRATIVYTNGSTRFSPMFPSSSAGSKQASAGLRTTITGRTRSGRQSLPMPRPISLSLAWENGRWWKLPVNCQAARTSNRSGTSGGPHTRWNYVNGATGHRTAPSSFPGSPKSRGIKRPMHGHLRCITANRTRYTESGSHSPTRRRSSSRILLRSRSRLKNSITSTSCPLPGGRTRHTGNRFPLSNRSGSR